jgi:hypothetical protein
VMLESRASKDNADTKDEVTAEEEKSAVAKLWANYQYGLRKAVPAQLFYTTMQLKYFMYAIIFILIDGKEAQISLFIILTFVYCGYYVIVRPFDYMIQNVVVILNECFTLLIAFLFCGFLEDGDPDEDLATAIIVLFSIDIILCFILGFGFQMYLVVLKFKKSEAGSITPEPKAVRLQKKINIDHEENEIDHTEQHLKNHDYKDEEDVPSKESLRAEHQDNIHVDAKDKYIDAAEAAMNMGKNKDYDEEFHDHKNTLEKSLENGQDHINVLGGNLQS